MTLTDDRPWQTDPWDTVDGAEVPVARLHAQRDRRRWYVWGAMYVGLAALVVVGLVGRWYLGAVNPAGDPGDPVTFTVEEGDTFASVAERLHAEGLISSVGVFEWYVGRHGGLELTPGYYELRPADHMGNVMAVLRTPPSQTFTNVTFPEGYTLEQMGVRLADTVPRLVSRDFNIAATDGGIRSSLQPVEVTSLEGLLFPDTYQVSNSELERDVVRRMVALMERVAAQESLVERAPRVGLTPYEVLIVASLVEREAGVEEDRAKIARVILNRLALGMPLQIDASLYYRQDPDRPFDELKALDTPYNTYLRTGLPPTPIANPGRASIRAVLQPAADPSAGDPLCQGLPAGTECRWLYYVLADEEGRHVFAVTIEQHEANVQTARDAGLLG